MVLVIGRLQSEPQSNQIELKREVVDGSGLPHALLIGENDAEPYQKILSGGLKYKAPCGGMGLKE